MSTTQRTPTTPDVGGALARGWLMLLVSVLVFAGGGLAVGLLWPLEYEAKSTVSLSDETGLGDQTDMATQRLTITSSQVLGPASEQVGLEEQALRNSLTVLVPADSRVMEISAVDPDAGAAADKANAVAEAYSEFRAQQEAGAVRAQREVLSEQMMRLRAVLDIPRRQAFRDALLGEVASLQAERLAAIPAPAPVTVLTSASPPSGPATPPPATFAVAGAAIGLLLGVLLALLRDRTRPTTQRRKRSTS